MSYKTVYVIYCPSYASHVTWSTIHLSQELGRFKGCCGLRLAGSRPDFCLAQSVSLWPAGWPQAD